MDICAVIPAYNYARYLPRAIESVLAQTYPLREVLVVDDGSTDNTREVVRQYGDRVTYIYQDNAGLSAARNTGIRRSSSAWIGFLDADDWWLPRKVELQVEALQKDPHAVLAYTRILLATPDGTMKPGGWVPPERQWPRLRYANSITPSTVIARRDALLQTGGFDQTLRSCEDWDMWVRIREYGSFAGVAEPVTAYQVTPQSMSSNEQRMVDNTEKILEKSLLRGLSGVARVIWRRRIMSAAVYYAAIVCNETLRFRDARRYLFRSLSLWPSPGFLWKRWWALARLFIRSRAFTLRQ